MKYIMHIIFEYKKNLLLLVIKYFYGVVLLLLSK